MRFFQKNCKNIKRFFQLSFLIQKQKRALIYLTIMSLFQYENFRSMLSYFSEDQELTKFSSCQEYSSEIDCISNYSIERLIAVSGQAKIYKGKKDGLDYALKIYQSNPKNDKFFRNEKSFLQLVDDRGIVPMEQCISDVWLKTHEMSQGTLCNIIVMPFIRKGDLHTWVTQRQPFQERFGRYFALDIIGRMRYLDSKHIFHKDIKAENVMFGEDFRPLLIDFGLAADTYQLCSNFAGTARYASPEVVKQRGYTSKSEIYSLGVLFLFMLTGKYPYNIAKITESNYRLLFEKNFKQFWLNFEKTTKVRLSASFKDLFVKMIDHIPENRPSLDNILEFQWFKQDPITYKQYQQYMNSKEV